MPPPPVTPSPHRFVVKKEAVAPVRKTPLAQSHTPRPSTQQFNAAPRFTFSSTPRPAPSQNPPGHTPSAARFSTPAPRQSDRQDVIVNSSDEYRAPQDLHDSIEIDDEEGEERYGSADDGEANEDEHKLGERTPKRRRVTSPLIDDEGEPDLQEDEEPLEERQDNLSSSLPILSSPPAPKRHVTSTPHPRFLLSTPQLAATRHQASTAFLRPPRFRPPDPSETNPGAVDPLPEAFSPHRKGQKFVPGGLAAEVRDWLSNLKSSVSQSGHDEWLVRIVVDECTGGSLAGMTLVRGRQIHDEGTVGDSIAVRIMLAGEGQGIGVQRAAKVEIGKIVGVKGPVWEVAVDGLKWGVGVEWQVLN